MSIFRKITESFGKGKLKKEQREELYEIIRLAVLDGKITNDELRKIKHFYSQSGLSEKYFSELKDSVYRQIVQMAISDRRITEQEKQSLRHIANTLGISPQIYDQMRKEISYFSLLTEVCNGVLPKFHPNGVVLQKKEIAHLEMPAYLMEQRVISHNTVGRSSGFSFRIMKGVTYRVGSSRGTITSQTGWVNVSSGNFIITNKRLIFSGQQKSFSFDLSKLLDMQLYSDGIKIAVTNRQKPVMVGMYSDRAGELCGTIISTVINS